jgi:hypothetical protein
MKLKQLSIHVRLGLTALVLGSAGSLLAQTADLTIATFDTATGAGTDNTAGTGIGWGTSSWAWDSVEGNPAGSVEITASLSSASDTPLRPRFCVNGGNPWYNAGTIAFSQYKNIQFDIKWDNTSDLTIDQFNNVASWPLTITNKAGQLLLNSAISQATAGFDVLLCGPGGNQGSPTITNILMPAAAANGWVHITIPINQSLAGLDGQSGITFNKWINNYGGQMTANIGTAKFWIDNITLGGTAGPPPPPTTYLTPVVPGLKQFADMAPSYQRQDVRTGTNGAALVSWVGRPKPVVYSFTIAEFPTQAGFNCTLNLSPGDPATQTFADPDWNMPNTLWFNIQANGDGSQAVRFAYKTNQPAGNSQMFGTGTGVLTNFNYNGSAVGTWTLTFTSDTDATIKAPNGSTYSASIPAENAALFADPACIYLMSSPGNDANIGQSMTFGSLTLSGVGTPINQDFTTGSLNSLLVLQSQGYNGPWNTNPPNQYLLTSSNGKYWHYWSLPDTGFSPIVKSNLVSGVWQDENYSSRLLNGTQRWALVPPASVPGTSVGFFALVKREFTQLQVLLPGQTNAPGTALGFVGTPTPISLASQGLNPTTVTVNACDATWHIITSVTDQIHLTTSDSGAFLPADMAMVNGTASFTGANGVLFQTQGSQTVTATDLTSTTVTTPANSAPVTIDP